MLKKIGIALLLIGAGIALQAQTFNPYSNHIEKNKETVISVHSVNLTAGLYAPEMNFWNENYLPTAGSDDEFGPSMVFGGNITFGILSEFRARVGVSYWSDKVKGGAAGFDELKISFTRFSLGAFYAPEFASFDQGIQLYVGFEAFYYDINNKLDMEPICTMLTSQDMNGHDVSFAPVIGIDKVFGKHILIGAEFTYMIGEYTQAVMVASQTQKVSIAGPQLSLSVGYKF
jgi:hypothetical protein